MLPQEETKPRPREHKGIKLKPEDLAAGLYGTYEMSQVWGLANTFGQQLRVQGLSASSLSELYPDVVPREHAYEIKEKASLEHVKSERILELWRKTGHDIIAVNTALEEVLSHAAAAHINKVKTSADTTQPARAIQLKSTLEVLAGSLENLRDIVIEKAVKWIDVPHMDITHGLDALPTYAGRPFVHYAEVLQSNLNLLKFVYYNSIVGKWSDVSGNYHSATALGIDGITLENEFCKLLGIGHMIAAAQLPGLEFEADIVYVAARTAQTINNLNQYIRWGKSQDVDIFVDNNPHKRKGSSGMPHKDIRGGNPDAEEQVESLRNKATGWMTTALMNCEMPYARSLAASANSRIDLEDCFNFLDHSIRRTAEVVYWLGLNEKRSKERVLRSFGVVTSQHVMSYLTDHRKVQNPMTRKEAHDLTARLATQAYIGEIPYVEVLLQNPEITSRIDEATLREITDPLKYMGKSREIILLVKDYCYKRPTLP